MTKQEEIEKQYGKISSSAITPLIKYISIDNQSCLCIFHAKAADLNDIGSALSTQKSTKGSDFRPEPIEKALVTETLPSKGNSPGRKLSSIECHWDIRNVCCVPLCSTEKGGSDFPS